MMRLGLMVLSLLTAGAASSAEQRPEQSVEQTFGHWSKVCAKVGSTRICRIVQSANQNDRLILQTEIGLAEDGQAPIMYLTTPLGIFLPSGIVIVVDQQDPIAVKVQKCEISGCLGVLPLDSDLIDMLEKGSKAQVMFGATPQQNMTVPLSLEGFGDAYASLYTRQKGGGRNE